MNVNFNGYGEQVTTFIADDTLTQPGVPVAVSDNGTVKPCDENENFCGVCVGVRNGYAAVQTAGFVTMPATAKIGVGYQKLTTGAGGTVATGAEGRELLVVESGEDEVGFIL